MDGTSSLEDKEMSDVLKRSVEWSKGYPARTLDIQLKKLMKNQSKKESKNNENEDEDDDQVLELILPPLSDSNWITSGNNQNRVGESESLSSTSTNSRASTSSIKNIVEKQMMFGNIAVPVSGFVLKMGDGWIKRWMKRYLTVDLVSGVRYYDQKVDIPAFNLEEELSKCSQPDQSNSTSTNPLPPAKKLFVLRIFLT